MSPGVIHMALWRMNDEERAEMMRKRVKMLAMGRAGQPKGMQESYLALFNDWNATGSVARSDAGGLFM